MSPLEIAGTMAAILLIFETILVGLVYLAIFFFGIRGMNFVLRKTAGAFHRTQNVSLRVEQVTEGTTRRAVSPLLWLYGRAAWVQTFTGAAWRSRGFTR
ncbi:MAG: hypothetical protein ACYC1C_03295 [Chloroflexota bacterium]